MALWPGQTWRSRGTRAQPGQPSGQLEGHVTLLAADAPGCHIKAFLQCGDAARPLSCHHRVTTHPSCWLNADGCGDRAEMCSLGAARVHLRLRRVLCKQSCNSRAAGGFSPWR